MIIRLPTDNDRISILGATGSGKTFQGVYQLSMRSYTSMPWIVYDFKRDDLINSIEGAEYLTPDSQPPTKPGLFIVHAHPDDETAIESQMAAIWSNENTGVFIDEGYMIGNRNRWFRSLLTQGRSKRVPMIILSQRPVWMDRFVFSESQFIQSFHLSDIEDQKAVQRYIVKSVRDKMDYDRLPEFYSYYYDVKSKQMATFPPAPDEAAILSTFRKRLATIQKTL